MALDMALEISGLRANHGFCVFSLGTLFSRTISLLPQKNYIRMK